MMRLKILMVFPFLAALAGCSSVYEVRAVVIDGKLAFVPADTNIWGEPGCIYSIEVSARDGPGAVTGETYWDKTFAVTSCENPFPIFYGSQLKGPPFRDSWEYNVEAKPLRTGVVYEVSTASKQGAYGSGTFLITGERKVVNLAR